MLNNESKESRLDKTEHIALGVSMSVIGAGSSIIGYMGVDYYEAQTPQDSVGSVFMGNKQAFISHEDFGFAALAFSGALIAGAGIMRIRSGLRRSR